MNKNSTVKKILLVSFSAGAGHKRAAEALRLTCAKKYPEIECRHIDLADYSSGLVKKTAAGYNFLAKHLPDLYGLIYDSWDTATAAKFLNYFSSLLKINTEELRRFVKKYQPDRIIGTHFMASPFLKTFTETIPMDMLVTDYELNRVVLDPKIRFFFAPTKEVAEEINKAGRQAFAYGIPVHSQFLEEKNPKQIMIDWGLNATKPTVLLMSGGEGFTDTSFWVEKIFDSHAKINLVVISGKSNQRLFEKLNSLKPPRETTYKLVDFTDRIDEIMRVAALVVTKPGGLTVTECLFLKKPMLLIDPIPGQEEANVKFVEKNNYGRLLTDHNEISKMIHNILSGKTCFCQPDISGNASEKILEKTING